MTILEKVKSVLASLKFEAKAKEGKLTPQEAAQVQAEYKKQFDSDLATDITAAMEAKEKEDAYESICVLLNEYVQNTSAESDIAEGAVGNTVEIDTSSIQSVLKGVQAVISDNKRLKEENQKMSQQSQGDSPEKTFTAIVNISGGMTTENHLFGIQHPMFAMDKRWNRLAAGGRAVLLSSNPTDEDYTSFKVEVAKYGAQISARFSMLHAAGMLNLKALTTEGTVDYSTLTDAGLGSQYVVRRMDALIARILMLPSVGHLFPKRSNVQDEDLITNAFFGEFSQSYQEGEISKGGVALVPEKAKVHDVMFKYLIKSWKWLETEYLGYLNKEGSDPVKWSMIEWLVLQIATVLNNEQNKRYIQGCRVDPIKGENSHYLFGSTGVMHRLLNYIEEFKVLPYKDAEICNYTSATIGDAMDALAEEVSNEVEDITKLHIYVNAKHKPWYLAWYRSRYGKDIDFSGAKLTLMNYDVQIDFVPHMGNSKMMWMTEPGNMQILENLPGEMNAVKFQQNLESVWTWSVWKEGTSAAFSGKKFSTLAALIANGRKDQVIFMNYPATILDADATKVDGTINFLFVTAANTAATTIADIENAKAGVIYKIEIGNASNPSKIAREGRFSNITAWNPTQIGEWIKVYYNPVTDKFVEVGRFIPTQA